MQHLINSENVKTGEAIALLGNSLVLDRTSGLGSFCPKLLADLGAQVVKIEPPGGDPARDIGSCCNAQSLSFAYHDAGKHRVVLDLETALGKKAFLGFLKKADVLVESFSCSASRGLDPARINPRLIHITVPDGQRSYPLSLYAAIAAVLCLIKREITGRGCAVDMAFAKASGPARGSSAVNSGRRLFQMLPCRDGFIGMPVLGCWETLLELMASENMAGSLAGKEWQEEAYRENHIGQIAQIAAEWTRRHSKKELFELGQAMRFPWAPVETPEEVLKSPQLGQRCFFVPTALPGGGPVLPFPGIPYKISSCSPAARGKIAARLSKRRGIHDEEILKGLRVIDLTRMVSGPYATRILADFGAEVIKIQSRATAQGAERNDSVDFNVWNRNKLSLGLDLNQPEAKDLFIDLAAVSDIVVENYSPRVMANWGLDYSKLCRGNPQLIMASISAMGQSGPWKDFVGFAPTFHALSGLLWLFSPSPEAPEDIPVPYGDFAAAAYSALAILAATLHRERTGEGRHIDVSAYETACALAGPALIACAANTNPAEKICIETTFPDLDELWPWEGKEPNRWKNAPLLGQDSRYVAMAILGRSEAEFESLAKKGVIEVEPR